MHFVDSDNVVAVTDGGNTRLVAILVGLHKRPGKVTPLKVGAVLRRDGQDSQTEQQRT